MALAPELIDAYENADYVVFTDPELVLRIGEPSPRLDALLEAEGATAAAYITAANPRGELKTQAENESAGAALDELLASDIYRANAEALGRIFGQNAIVFVEKGSAPELVIC